MGRTIDKSRSVLLLSVSPLSCLRVAGLNRGDGWECEAMRARTQEPNLESQRPRGERDGPLRH